MPLGPVPFVRARHFRAGRFVPIRGVCIHTNGERESSRGAETWAAHVSRWRYGASAHYVVDSDRIVQMVHDKDRAIAAGPGDDAWIHVELVGSSSQDFQQWDDAFSRAQLKQAGQLIGELSRRHQFPIEIVSNYDLVYAPDKRGVTSHGRISDACKLARAVNCRELPWWDCVTRTWRTTTHKGPGLAFPWPTLFEHANAAT